MKNKKRTKFLVSSFIAAMSLSACSPVSVDDKAIVGFTGYDGKEINVISESMYNEYLKDSTKVSSFYEKILEVLIRYDYAVRAKGDAGSGIKVEKTLTTIKEKVERKIKNEQTTASTNAKNNNTSYSDEWDKILESNGVEDTEGLRQKFLYQEEKSEIQTAYNLANIDELKKQFIGVDKQGKGYGIVDGKQTKVTGLPYHVKHILIKNDNSSDFTRSTISAEVAKKLSDTVRDIAVGTYKTFNGAAAEHSDDTSSSEFGDVGIVSNSASQDGNLTMVPEFQLGIYAYDNLFNRDSSTVNAEVKKGLGLSLTNRLGNDGATEYLDNAGGNGSKSLLEVPYEVFTKLGKYSDVTKTKDDVTLSDNEAVYPRNILWNKYLNHHDVFVITNRSLNTYASTTIANDIKTELENPNMMEKTWVADSVPAETKAGNGSTGFVSCTQAGLTSNLDTVSSGERKVLVDEKGQVIFGVCSQYGIHLMIIEKSINDFAVESSATSDVCSIEEYYTTEVPSSSKYPTYNAGTVDNPVIKSKSTYINALNDDPSVMSDRAETVKTKITGFDSTSEYALYEKLIATYGESTLKFYGDGTSYDIGKLVKSYISTKRNAAVYKQTVNMGDAWAKYVELLEAQYEARNLSTKNTKQGLVPEGCIIGFDSDYDNVKNLYEKGGICYYA